MMEPKDRVVQYAQSWNRGLSMLLKLDVTLFVTHFCEMNLIRTLFVLHLSKRRAVPTGSNSKYARSWKQFPDFWRMIKLFSPLPPGGHRMSRFAFRSRRIFPVPFDTKRSSNGQLEAVVLKLLAQSHNAVTAVLTVTLVCFCFSPPNALFFVTHHTAKLGMKDSLKAQQWWVERFVPITASVQDDCSNHYTMFLFWFFH